MKILTLAGVFLISLPISRADERKPNIIVIMADDVGYGDISSYGYASFKTPNIDKLAAEGSRFTSGYCSASTCTPTRYSLLTGTYAFRKRGMGHRSAQRPRADPPRHRHAAFPSTAGRIPHRRGRQMAPRPR